MMLRHIHIKDFATLSNLDLELKSQMTVITGETGAGKSIVIDAVSLALGSRLDGPVVRVGQERAEISLSFEIGDHSDVQKWLQENELNDGDDCVIRRTIAKDGRTRSFINSTPATLQLVKSLAEQLISIHGQNEHQTLLKAEAQGAIVDAYAKNQTLVNEVNTLYGDWTKIHDQINRLETLQKEKAERLNYLSYLRQEFLALALQSGEIEKLHLQQQQLANNDRFIQDCQGTLRLLEDNDKHNVLSQLNQCTKYLESHLALNTSLKNSTNIINNALIELTEATHEIRHQLSQSEQNPERLLEIESRLSAIHDLARKHKCKPETLIELQYTIENEFDALNNSEETIENLQEERDRLAASYFKKADMLTSKRKESATKLSAAITENMQQLNMIGGKFAIQLEELARDTPKMNGLERISFCVAANPGHPLQPLNKVASGGELSRISLALQVVIANQVTVPTMIFDEVDVGIGGKTAAIVGELLRRLGANHQILCVTHLPQVAACGHHHLRVEKHTTNDMTTTELIELKDAERVEEIARMLGGKRITEQSLAHASEMLVER